MILTTTACWRGARAGDKFKLTVLDSLGWEWKSDSNNKDRPKFGYISTTPGVTATG